MKAVRDAGFSLVEALVALTVFAVSAVAFLTAIEGGLRRVGAIEARAAALISVQNELARQSLGWPAATSDSQLGHDMILVTQDEVSPAPGLRRLAIRAGAVDGDTVLASVTGFVAVPVPKPEEP